MDGFGTRVDGPAGRRRKERAKVAVEVQMVTRSRTWVGVLLDISQSGARAQSYGEIAVGEDLRLKLAGMTLFGTVVWREPHGVLGIQFDEQAGAAEVATLIQHARRVGLSVSGLHMRSAADDWSSGFAR